MSMQLEECIAVLSDATVAWADSRMAGVDPDLAGEVLGDARESVAAAVLGVCVALGCPSDRAHVIAFLSSQPR